MNEQLVNIREMAAILGVQPSWLYKRTCRPGAIPHLKLGKYVRFRPSEVMAFFNKGPSARLES